MTPPNHLGYMQFPAALLIIFASMFVAVAWRPGRNANLILYGIRLKAAYCATVLATGRRGCRRSGSRSRECDLLWILVLGWAWRVLRPGLSERAGCSRAPAPA